MSQNRKIDGATSLGLPGVQGNKGMRSRVFFYGNSSVQDETHRKIYIGTTQSDLNTKTKYAIITDDNVIPEPYDYVLYTTVGYDYILIILSVAKDGDNFKCIVKKIDELDLTKSSSTSDSLGSIELNFNINKVKRSITKRKRNPFDYCLYRIRYSGFWGWGAYDHTTSFPRIESETTNNELVDISLSIPSNSSYVFDSNIKVTVEFFTRQSFVMDTMLHKKFDGVSNLRNTYRGDYEKYSIVKQDGNTFTERPINFDDERLENFIYVIKDFDEGVGTRNFTASFPLMTPSLKRAHNNAEAFLFAYIKNGRFIDKFLIDKFDLSFIDSEDDISTSSYEYEWNDRTTDSSTDPDIPDTPDIPVIPVIHPIIVDTWTCDCCGTTGNVVGLVCSGCGRAQGDCLPGGDEDLTWTCNCCGATGQTGIKCSICGNRQTNCLTPYDPYTPSYDPSDPIDIDINDNEDFNNHLPDQRRREEQEVLIY